MKEVRDMKDREILDHIKNSIDESPIDLLENIKSQQVVKMLKHDNITRQRKVSFKPIMSFVSAAAVFMLVFFNFQQFRLPDSQIYLDVNPGIQITTNNRDKVIKLEAINEDAKNIIENIDFLNTYSHLIPFFYGEAFYVVMNSGPSFIVDNPNLNYRMGLLVTSIGAILSLAASMLIVHFRKRI